MYYMSLTVQADDSRRALQDVFANRRGRLERARVGRPRERVGPGHEPPLPHRQRVGLGEGGDELRRRQPGAPQVVPYLPAAETVAGPLFQLVGDEILDAAVARRGGG